MAHVRPGVAARVARLSRWVAVHPEGSSSVAVMPVAGRVGHSIGAALMELLRLTAGGRCPQPVEGGRMA